MNHPDEELARRVLVTARERNLRPRSPWSVRSGQLARWTAVVVTVLSGALAFSLTIAALWPDGLRPGGLFVRYTWGLLPVLWIVFLLGFVGAGLWAFRHLRYGYRARGGLVLVGILGASLVLGASLYSVNGGFRAHRFLMGHVGAYSSLFEEQRRAQWSRPEEGRLSGIVTKIDSNDLRLRAWSGSEWSVHLENAIPRFKAGDSLRLRGSLCGSGFCAEWARLWLEHGPGMGHGSGHGMGGQRQGRPGYLHMGR
jgi:hypothetical protein